LLRLLFVVSACETGAGRWDLPAASTSEEADRPDPSLGQRSGEPSSSRWWQQSRQSGGVKPSDAIRPRPYQTVQKQTAELTPR
jgi:hypothetical protein